MRISDWSSDVCSSDLQRFAPRRADHPPLDALAAAHCGAGLQALLRDGAAAAHQERARGGAAAGARPCDGERILSSQSAARDRKNVVEGKSGEVRGDQGCRRSIKNKKQKSSLSNKTTQKLM